MTDKRWFRVQAIGAVHRDGSADLDQFLDPAAPSVIRIDSRWEGGLTGIEGFSHLCDGGPEAQSDASASRARVGARTDLNRPKRRLRARRR